MTRARFNATLLNVNPAAAARGEMTEILRQAGFEVCEAASGAEALEASLTPKLDVVLLPTRLPDMSGSELIRRINEDPATASLMVIQTSVRCAAGDWIDALETGAALIPEPVDSGVLVATINALVKFRWSREQLSDRVDELETELRDLKLLAPSPALHDSKIR